MGIKKRRWGRRSTEGRGESIRKHPTFSQLPVFLQETWPSLSPQNTKLSLKERQIPSKTNQCLCFHKSVENNISFAFFSSFKPRATIFILLHKSSLLRYRKFFLQLSLIPVSKGKIKPQYQRHRLLEPADLLEPSPGFHGESTV